MGFGVMMLRNNVNNSRKRPAVYAKSTVGLAVAAASVLALSACGAGGSSTETNGDSDELTVMVEAGGLAELQPIADLYEKEVGTKITFVELPYDGLYNRLNSEFSAGSVSFDIAALDSIWLPAFKDAVTPLNDLFTDEVKSDLFPALVQEAQLDGNYVGMPAWTNSEILFYRTDLFGDPEEQQAFKAQYGYDLIPPTTWQQYEDVAEFFTRDIDGDGQTDLYGTDVKGAVETEWLATLSQAGEEDMVIDADGVSTLGDQASLDALNFYSGLQEFAPPGSAQVDWAGAQNLFYQGQTAMMRFWGHAFPQTPEDSVAFGNVGAAPMIGGAAGVAGVPGPWYLSLAQASEKQEQGLDFLQFAYDHNDLSIETSLGLASRISAFEKYQDDPKYAAFKPLIETLSAPATIPRPATPKWQQIVDSVLVPMIQKSLEPGADNQQLLDDAKKQVDAITK